MPARPAATLTDVCGVHAALGSSRSGWSGNASRSASIAFISSSGGNTPPLSLIAVKPYSSIIRVACATMPVGVERLAPRVGLGAGVRGPLVEQVGAERHGVADRAAEQIGDRPAGGVALHVEAGHLERREHLVDGAGRGDHARGADGGVVAARAGRRWRRESR